MVAISIITIIMGMIFVACNIIEGQEREIKRVPASAWKRPKKIKPNGD